MPTPDRIHPPHISLPLPRLSYSAQPSPDGDDDDDNHSPPYVTPPLILDNLPYFPQPAATQQPHVPSTPIAFVHPLSLQPPSILIHATPSPSALPPHHSPSDTDDTYPTAPNLPLDLPLDDEGLTALEKIYLFSLSKSVFHRVYIVHAMPSLLDQVSPVEATKYVLPLLSGLADDQGPSDQFALAPSLIHLSDESVKEALAAELIPTVWWFLTVSVISAIDPSSRSRLLLELQAHFG